MSKTESRYVFQRAFRIRKPSGWSLVFLILKIISFFCVLATAFIENSWLERHIIYSGKKSMHHTGKLITTDKEFLDSQDFLTQGRDKSSSFLYSDVRLFQKKEEKFLRPECVENKVCVDIKTCNQLKCIKIIEKLEEIQPDKIRIKDQDNQKMLQNYMFYIRPKHNRRGVRPVPQLEQTLVFYPSFDFNVFTLRSIFYEFLYQMNGEKKPLVNQFIEQSWQNVQKIQEYLDYVKPNGLEDKMLHPDNLLNFK